MSIAPPLFNQARAPNMAWAERILPWLLPVLLLSSRTLADIGVVAVCLLFLYRAYHLRDWQWAAQPWFKLALLFAAYVLLINAPLSVDPRSSLLYGLTFLRWPLFAAALAYWLLADHSRQAHFLRVLLAVCALIVVDSAVQYLLGHDVLGRPMFTENRLTGPYNSPIPGITLLRVWFIAMFAPLLLLPGMAASRRQTWLLLMMATGMVFMFITGERMAFMLFLTGSLVTLFGLWLDNRAHSGGQTIRQTHLWLAAISILLLLGLIILLAPATAERSVYSIFDKLGHFADSDYGKVFRAAIAAWQQAPLFGHGFHAYRQVCEQMGVLEALGITCTHAHNLYLQLGAETGVTGVLLFVCMLLAIYWAALATPIRQQRWLIAALACAVLSVCYWPLIGGISLLNNWVAALAWLGVGWVLAMRDTRC
ncbi:MAG TPA: O-antigen ligase family protein [Methylovorus sp.]|jgi:O-antigen ligase|nr:O-antigen ligase family protein [Methylovorus sp.]